MEIEQEILEQNLKCPICLNIVKEPWETTCCGNLFCQKCMKECGTSQCPICRNKKFKFRKNVFAIYLLTQLEKKCPYGCNKNIKLNKIKEHKYECDESLFKCRIDKCNFEGKKNESLNHLVEIHGDVLAIISENFSSLFPIFDKLEIMEKIQNKEQENVKSKNTVNSVDI